jgi:hypothetical protein
MLVETLPPFDENTGPASQKYFRAVALSKKLRDEREKLFEEGQQIRKDNPRGLDAFAYQNTSGKPRQLNAAEAQIAEFLHGEAETAAPPNHEALARCREIGATTREIDDAIHKLGERLGEFHVRANKEYVLSIKDHYWSIGARIAAALVELAQAVDEHDAFVEALRKKEVHHFSWLDIVAFPSWDKLRRMLRTAFDAGHIGEDTLKRWSDK